MIRKHGHDSLPWYGMHQGFNSGQWQDILTDLQDQGYLARGNGDYPTLCLTEMGESALKEGRRIIIFDPVRAKHPETGHVLSPGNHPEPGRQGLYDRLKALRNTIAGREGLMPYMVLPDAALRDIARKKPRSREALSTIEGVSRAKAERYGQEIIAEVQAYASTHGPIRETPATAKKAVRAKTKTSAPQGKTTDKDLFDALRSLRSTIAGERGCPAFIIFHDATLREMAKRRPTTSEAFMKIPGVGKVKLERYGERFLKVIRLGHSG
jgi:ATP-dependent DNA helicase RecQ